MKTTKIVKRFGIFFNDKLIELSTGKSSWKRQSDATQALSWEIKRLWEKRKKINSLEDLTNNSELFQIYELGNKWFIKFDYNLTFNSESRYSEYYKRIVMDNYSLMSKFRIKEY